MSLDWKNYSHGWPYSGDIGDPKYLMDRAALFLLNGNGWWITPDRIEEKDFEPDEHYVITRSRV